MIISSAWQFSFQNVIDNNVLIIGSYGAICRASEALGERCEYGIKKLFFHVALFGYFYLIRISY